MEFRKIGDRDMLQQEGTPHQHCRALHKIMPAEQKILKAPCIRKRRRNVADLVHPHMQRPELLIHQLRIRTGQVFSADYAEQQLQMLFSPYIVLIGKGNIVTGTQGNSIRKILLKADIPGIPHRLYGRKTLSILLHNLPRAVRRAVVAYQQLKIAHRLAEDRIQLLAQVFFAVVRGQGDGHKRHAVTPRTQARNGGASGAGTGCCSCMQAQAKNAGTQCTAILCSRGGRPAAFL